MKDENGAGNARLVTTIPTRHGPMMAFANDLYVTRSLQVYGEYSPDEAQALEAMISPGQTVVEVGANIGALTVPLARRCAPGAVYAFEPQRLAFQILCGNLAANEIRNVWAYPEACGSEAGVTAISAFDYNRLGNFGNAVTGQESGPERVKVTPVDALDLPACHLIKVDVEGAEADVIRGAVKTIERCKPVLYVENAFADKQQEVIDLIAGLGYRLFWHSPPLYSPGNFNGVDVDVFARIGSMNMLCVHQSDTRQIKGLREIDPKDWKAPF